MKHIIFMSGFLIPKWLAQSKFVWDKAHWEDYQCFWLDSKVPYSDIMVSKELDNLERLLNKYPEATFAGHSLGAWWISNLMCRPTVEFRKTVLWTPLTHADEYPVFNVSPRYNPMYQIPNLPNTGAYRNLVVYANQDLIVPSPSHALSLSFHFKSMTYQLLGGHLYQKNHKAALNYMKDWVEQ